VLSHARSDDSHAGSTILRTHLVRGSVTEVNSELFCYPRDSVHSVKYLRHAGKRATKLFRVSRLSTLVGFMSRRPKGRHSQFEVDSVTSDSRF